MKLSIIIIDFNSSQYIESCLKSLNGFAPSLPYEIIVVDNASLENHLESYKQINHVVKTYRLDKNIGFGAANNFAVEQSTGEYILLLNPDTLIVDDSIDTMAKFLELHQEIGALTCLLYGKDKKTLQRHFFGKFQSLLGLTLRHYNYQKVEKDKEFFYTDIVTGACLMIRRDLFKKVGRFDENIFMYLEDDDLCKRLVDYGYKNAVLNAAKIIHLEGKSSNRREKKKYYFASQNYYWQKHNGYFATLMMKALRFPFKIFVFLRSK